MRVGLLLVTHERIGDELLGAATAILGHCPLRANCLSVSRAEEPAAIVARGAGRLAGLDQGAGVLLLTDAFGSTPSNVAVQLAQAHELAVVTGVNLPMLLRVLNYPDLPLEELRRKALSGGLDGIVLVEHRQ